jgi:putative ABC transport system ATP-binding protein
MRANDCLRLEGLVVGRRSRAVARVPDFALGAGEGALLLGRSGAGKSTALVTLAGLLAPISGAVILRQERLASGSKAPPTVGLIFQDVHLLSGLSVLENILLAPFVRGLPQDIGEARRALAAVGLASLADRRAETLSRGEAQRVAIARALFIRPALILADEPTASLDDDNAETVADLLQDAAQRTGAALVIATHDQRLKRRIANHQVLLPVEAVAA